MDGMQTRFSDNFSDNDYATLLSDGWPIPVEGSADAAGAVKAARDYLAVGAGGTMEAADWVALPDEEKAARLEWASKGLRQSDPRMAAFIAEHAAAKAGADAPPPPRQAAAQPAAPMERRFPWPPSRQINEADEVRHAKIREEMATAAAEAAAKVEREAAEAAERRAALEILVDEFLDSPAAESSEDQHAVALPERVFAEIWYLYEIMDRKLSYHWGGCAEHVNSVRKTFEGWGYTVIAARAGKPALLVIGSASTEDMNATNLWQFKEPGMSSNIASMDLIDGWGFDGGLCARFFRGSDVEASSDGTFRAIRHLVYGDTRDGVRSMMLADQYLLDGLKVEFDLPAAWRLAVGEAADALAEKVPRLAVPLHDVQAIGDQVDWDPDAMRLLMQQHPGMLARSQTGPKYLVEGLIPAGELSILAAPGKQGKSTIAHHLANAVTARRPDFLGHAIPDAGRAQNAVILTGEESPGSMAERDGRMKAGGLNGKAICRPHYGVPDLTGALAEIERIPNLVLVVIDSENYWMRGNNKEAKDTAEFLAILSGFMGRTRAAVLLMMHTNKGVNEALCRSLTDVLSSINGGPAWPNRARVTMTILKKGRSGLSRFGVIATNDVLGAPLSDILLTFDPETALHARHEGPPPAAARSAPHSPSTTAGQPSAGNDANAAADAVGALTAAGQKVRRTGAQSLFKLGPDAVSGWGRARTIAAVDAAITAGLLVDTPKGLYPVENLPAGTN